MLRFMQIDAYACSFAPTLGIDLLQLNCGYGNKWRGRATMQSLSAEPPGGDPLPDPFPGSDDPEHEPTLPTPTDVPPPTPTDVPVPEPWDVPPPDPKDFRPRSIP